jgi:hypothetical protein
MIKIDCPVYIIVPRKTKKDRKYSLNLNQYRNWKFMVSNMLKDTFSEGMRRVLSDVKLKDELYISYKYYKGSNRRSDKNNVISIVDKFFCDSLVKYDIIPDDNDNIIISTHNHQTEIDKLNPRVEARLFNNKEDYLKDIIKNL